MHTRSSVESVRDVGPCLVVAVQKGHTLLVQLLLRHPISPHYLNQAILSACRHNQPAMVASLLSPICQLTTQYHTLVINTLSTAMMIAVEHGYTDVLEQVISVLRPLTRGSDLSCLQLHEHDWTVLKLLASRSAIEGRPTIMACLDRVQPEPV